MSDKQITFTVGCTVIFPFCVLCYIGW